MVLGDCNTAKVAGNGAECDFPHAYLYTHEMRNRARYLSFAIGVIFCLLFAGSSQAAQNESAESAIALLNRMTTDQRVGQLFLVTYDDRTLAIDSEITELITDFHVGGVALTQAGNHLTSSQNAPQQIAVLNNDLQRLALVGDPSFLAENVDLSNDAEVDQSPFEEHIPIPLFIALNPDAPPALTTTLWQGFTPIPSEMAIGATWQPAFAQTVGQVVGANWSAVGSNLFIGPPLDVLDSPFPSLQRNPGAALFGGDPYWVGLMGQAYVAGIHQGSQGKIAVIPSHFPGSGSSDRPINQEIATVQKSLEQLQQTELAPFFAVAGAASDPLSVAEGYLSAHVRYLGFQGNIQASTAPVSLDPQALSTLFQLEPLANWRTNGGLLISDKLGARAIQRFYDITGDSFPHRQIAKDALLAGNDLLYLAEYRLDSDPPAAELENIKDTIISFQERYATDPTFQQRVDQAVVAILTAKLKLYDNNFSLNNVLVTSDNLEMSQADQNSQLNELAQQAITLIAPNPEGLPARLPSPPGINDQILIFTDVRFNTPCPGCPPTPLIDQFALEERLLNLYGPAASGQVRQEQIQSYTFADLNAFLNAGNLPISLPTPAPTVTPISTDDPTPTPAPTPAPPPAYLIQQSMPAANWIIFVTLDYNPRLPASSALQRFLAERPDLARNAKTVAFAFDAPIYLDTTEISKLSAYYGVYSYTPQFLDASARVLFQESALFGRPPIDIEAIDYRLSEATQPNPDQTIELYIVADGITQSPGIEAPFQGEIGDSIRLQTGVILDQNRRPVPDGTLVEFKQLDRIEGLLSVIAESPTINGIATVDYILEDRPGKQYGVFASAGAAVTSAEVDIAIGDRAIISVATPTQEPTVTPTQIPSSTPTPSPTPTDTPTPTPTITVTPTPQSGSINIAVTDLTQLLGMGAGIGLMGIAGIFLGSFQGWQPDKIAPLLLWGIVGGLAAYLYFALNMPGAQSWQETPPVGALLFALLGGVLGYFFKWLYEFFADL